MSAIVGSRALGLLVAGLTLVLSGCAPAPSTTAAPGLPGTLRWEPCAGSDWPATARCADLPVPLDHARPEGPRITVRVSWVPAADPTAHRGALVSNPGGPGASGLRNAVLDAAPSPAVRSATAGYDLVGFDPRGVGASTPLRCDVPAGAALAARAPSPSRTGPGRDEADAAAVADACRLRGGPLLEHMTTADVADDLDDLRSALGLARFSYYGSSYGTYLGVVYDALHPGHLDRVVLDSLVDSEHGWHDQVRQVARATEKRFDDFAAWAATQNPATGLGTSPSEVRERYLDLAATLQRAPLAVPGRVVDGADLRRATYALVGRNRFPQLAALLRCAAAAPGAPCGSELGAGLAELEQAGAADDNATSVFFAVTCTDSPWPRDPAAYRGPLAEDAARYPVTAGGFAQISPCASWPAPARPTVTAPTRPGPAQILMLNNTRDRISDLDGARATRAALGDRARFVTVAGWNHQILGNRDPCADTALAAWLGDGRLPDGDITCP